MWIWDICDEKIRFVEGGLNSENGISYVVAFFEYLIAPLHQKFT